MGSEGLQGVQTGRSRPFISRGRRLRTVGNDGADFRDPMTKHVEMLYVAYVQQPVPLEGVSALRVFRRQADAVAFLRASYDGFLSRLSDVEIREWGEHVGENVAVGVIRAPQSSWFGKVVERPVEG